MWGASRLTLGCGEENEKREKESNVVDRRMFLNKPITSDIVKAFQNACTHRFY